MTTKKKKKVKHSLPPYLTNVNQAKRVQNRIQNAAGLQSRAWVLRWTTELSVSQSVSQSLLWRVSRLSDCLHVFQRRREEEEEACAGLVVVGGLLRRCSWYAIIL